MMTNPGVRLCSVLCSVLGGLLLGAGGGIGASPARAQGARTPPAKEAPRAAPRAAPPRAKATPSTAPRPVARRAATAKGLPPRPRSPHPHAQPPAPVFSARAAPCNCPKPPQGPKRSGLALQLALGTSAQVYASTIATAAYPGLSGRFEVGYRYRRVTIGLGFEFVRTESKDLAGEERNAHLVLFRPTLEVALWRPWPLSLYLTLGVHGGFLGTEGRNVVDDELPAVGFHSGLGVRYFLHPRFALGMEGGFQGVWLVDDDGDDTVDGTVMFYGAIVLLAIL